MQAECYVITIDTNSESINVANRCINSGNKFGLDIKIFNAFTPRHNPLKILESKNFNIKKIKKPGYHSYESAVAGCFLSHLTLWEKCIEINKTIIILEHDAIIINEIPFNILDGTGFDKVINLGKPAHGKFDTPEFTGAGLMVSSHRFKGTHAYAIKPAGALKLINQGDRDHHGKIRASPADIYLNTKTFPFLEELYPWPVITKLEFSTIQKSTNRYSTNSQLDEFGKSR